MSAAFKRIRHAGACHPPSPLPNSPETNIILSELKSNLYTLGEDLPVIMGGGDVECLADAHCSARKSSRYLRVPNVLRLFHLLV